ncbi:MAG: NTPase (NACHT family)-like protein [Spirochaetia bacterium]|nr:NTPase (NACHT family)-like protein [Spirochaetia bacterium]
MDYSLEQLGPERFQEVCQALLTKAFPRTQCFPIAQPDGGRDAVSRFSGEDGFVVYQVKFVRKASDPISREWLKDIVEKEAPKVRDLIPKGAKEYYLLTNVPGTAHPSVGSIDLVQEVFSEYLPIPAQCWWRDDLNRRLDDSWNIKWAYPEILSSQDILRAIVESGLGEHANRRTSAIKAFLRDQFQRDTEVRFKQVELQNKLLDLFIDVPLNFRDGASKEMQHRRHLFTFSAIANQIGRNSGVDEGTGAATLLLHSATQEHLKRTVLEGAPGQGKSTIVQYVCQIHRSRILNEGISDERIPQGHRLSPVRLPFKVDCRDFALWLNRQNPFAAEASAQLPEDWLKSLESFLAAQVSHYSGGAAFDVSDFHAVARISALLIVFDGLDEVADIGRRRDVIDHITKGIGRIEEVAVSLQTVVTTRPAAFVNSPAMPDGTFSFYHLASINRPLIEQYAEKWLIARRLPGKEAAEVRRILREKLDQPHLKELARNPMQLAILLSLIQTRGGSLPDKRTALYDNYVELFFSREAEKSNVVRDHRDLLLDIHRYLAWILHSEAQTAQNRGSVSSERLRQLVSDYLNEEGHDSSLVAPLFDGMVERVVALVSRVEGTYEFEVQPLREYFAARHLYETAPYSPAGNPVSGTLPDRFDALSRDFFWYNVTRFYAGCFNKGELSSLVDRLEELSKAEGYRNTRHPKTLAATLLADWVFAQQPRSMKKVVTMVLNGIGLINTRSGRPFRHQDALILPRQNGQEELLERCFHLLDSNPHNDYAMFLIELIKANASLEDILSRWLAAVKAASGPQRTAWIGFGLYLGALAQLEEEQITVIMGDGKDETKRLTHFLHGGKSDYVESDASRFTKVLDFSLAQYPLAGIRRGSSIANFLNALWPQRYAIVFQDRQPIPLKNLWSRYHLMDSFASYSADSLGPEATSRTEDCRRVIETSLKLAERPASGWATELEPWNELVEQARHLFGERWLFFVLANLSAGITSKSETCDDAPNLHDSRVSLCRRARYARLRAGAANWWEEQILSAGAANIQFTLLILLQWGGWTVLEKNAELIDEKLLALNQSDWLRLSESIGIMQEKKDTGIPFSELPTSLSERTIAAFGNRIRNPAADDLVRERLRSYEGDDPAVLRFCQRVALGAAHADATTWQDWLPIVSRAHSAGVESDESYAYYLAGAIRAQRLPLSVAEQIIENCENYPAELVAVAEETCRQNVAEKITPVGEIAKRDNWFDN